MYNGIKRPVYAKLFLLRTHTDLFLPIFSPRSCIQFAWWDSETRGNWIWGYIMLAFYSGEGDHEKRAVELADGLLATQDPDGYIGVYDEKWRCAQHT